ncbi:hypothetical protein [Nocardiopsis metallicus]|uniref:Uncharacterized protein n=1 Tax=Nocardiopsis metallicus TaxID=179819 RepID=A0A840W5C7_9ACTN|nr:hypothetical protein [Nocardiopsis metallicus]MBB5490543.1 hypothetical protein [Nocardiopsis metallicus]
MHPDDLAELERRIRIIESPGYHDPAHADLPACDLALVVVAVTAVSTLLLWWGLA